MHRKLLPSLLLIVAPSLLGSESERQEEPVRWTVSNRSATMVGELSGTWRVLKADWNPKVVAGLPKEIRFDVDHVDQVPAEGKFAGLDFRSPDGSVVRAIYRFDGKKVIV